MRLVREEKMNYRLVSFEDVLKEFAAKKSVKLGKLLRNNGALGLEMKKSTPVVGIRSPTTAVPPHHTALSLLSPHTMDPTNFNNRRRCSPTTGSFFSFSAPSSSSPVGDDLNESDVFFHDNDFTTPKVLPVSADQHHRRHPSLSSPSKPIPSIPRPSFDPGQTQSVPSSRFQQHSAPMKVPILRMKQGSRVADVADDEDDEEMMPPHDMVARRLGASARMTFSVLEGAGRTLKGRDLRQVRNAIWRNTGFLD